MGADRRQSAADKQVDPLEVVVLADAAELVGESMVFALPRIPSRPDSKLIEWLPFQFWAPLSQLSSEATCQHSANNRRCDLVQDFPRSARYSERPTNQQPFPTQV